MRHLAAATALLLGFVATARAAPNDPLELATRFSHLHVGIVLDEQGRSVETRQWSRVVLKESALGRARTAGIDFSTSAQRGEILEAYTRKADGRRIDVPKGNYQLVINRGQGADSPVYSDETSLSVVFPDLAVGDTEVFSYRLVTTEPLFPGKFSDTEAFDPQAAYDDVRVRVDYPDTLPAQYGSFALQQAASAGPKGRRYVDWRWANPAPVESGRRDFSIVDLDQLPHYSFSTFTSYADIAQAYGARAAPKARVTPRLGKLAAEIVGPAATPRAQARALYEWTATHIGYAGNCIGIGAVVPRDVDFVLDNHLGDCKDHATLLQALLAARGIPSTQALVNAGAGFALPRVPVVSTVNHVIVYVPSLDLYLDATSSTTPFGRLPEGDQGKPVLLVDGYRAGARTPVAPPEATTETTRARFTVTADGAARGSTEVALLGSSAAHMRAGARTLPRNARSDLVREMFRAHGQSGTGTFTGDDPTALDDTYHYRVDYQLEKFVHLPGAGAFYVAPPTGEGSVQGALLFVQPAEATADVACRGGIAHDDYEIHFPPGLQVLSVPDDIRRENGAVAYAATYRLRGDVLTITRELRNKLPGPTCSPGVVTEYKQVGDEVMDDLRSQVLFKLPKPTTPKD